MNKPRFRLFAWYVGPDWYRAYTLSLQLAIGVRGDLMTQGDEGMMIPCVFGVDIATGRTFEAREDGRLDWVFRPWFRSDVSWIARRMAGGDE